MKRRRHTPQQIIRKLREADRLLAEGHDVPEVAKQLEISEATYHRWRAQYGGLKADDVKRLKELETENARLKRIVADTELQLEALKELGGETGEPRPPAPRRRAPPAGVRGVAAVGVPAGRAAPQHPTPSARRAGPRPSPRDELRQLSRAHPRWGYRRAHAVLREQGWSGNRMAIQRRWREEGLRVPARRRKRERLGVSTTPAARLTAEHPDHVWALDYQFDQTLDGRRLKLLNVVDEHTREALTIHLDRRIDADATVAVLDRLVAERRTAPRFIRCDNGPERPRCWSRTGGSSTTPSDPTAPWAI
jgi:putative transposase